MNSPEAYPTGSIMTLSDEECRARIQATAVGWIAFVNDQGQHLLPVNFAWINEAVYFRTAPDGTLAGLASGHDDVAFGVDHNNVFQVGWNVTVRGSAAAAEDPETIKKVLAADTLTPWAGGERTLVIELKPASIAGRRVSVR